MLSTEIDEGNKIIWLWISQMIYCNNPAGLPWRSWQRHTAQPKGRGRLANWRCQSVSAI